MIYGKHVKVSLKHHWEIASIIRCYGALKMIYRNCGIHTSYILIDFSQQAHAPPPAEGRWRRKRALASVGAALCLKIHFFFQVNSWVAILEQLKFLSGM